MPGDTENELNYLRTAFPRSYFVQKFIFALILMKNEAAPSAEGSA